MYAEVSGTPGEIGSLRSGVAITNTSATSTTAMFELTDLDGTSTGLRASQPVPPSGHIATFVDELFPTLTTPFQGVLRITSTTTNLAVIGLRARTNKRGDFLITTTPPSNEVRTPSSVDAYFPHIADSGGWATQFVLFSGTAGQTSTGTLSFIDQAGKPLDLSVSSSGSTSGIN